ncbi:efflux RND transporter permease subunit [Stenotrophomonas maltophilia]|jgi:HAE1 family hydrophobic/amphiphilic exporter-1|uniref:efflux RND transporter permease subunit n=1 Tax=Stenotrophomonas TaxID=40323 RepID=UPI00201CE49A|nr:MULTISPECIES: efflux RND transporter permease subunit [Stenotrophomonas]MBN5027309.1 efflux RND transporter permease subunit [Stenotrophomonas maltophilia]MDH1275480.1 efflux RND transporter permease subunit [Stenotrophomonas sp. GD03937]MDH1486697.1 efflux RND transporter permease subunit [Stenotrophomonas sp. GD03712]MDR2961244.1 efflux RND transporter permease subunit [Stenotrophomonas sp.]UQY97121.1 efflux RND transporter permease subunit [Stenotrophomonas maltophilia]
MSVAEFSIRRPVTTIMCFVSLVVIGLIASFRLPLEALPDISAPFLFVQIPYTGSTPEEVERTIIRPVEESLATMTGIKRMRSSATSEAALIYIEFSDWDRDIAIAASDARERIDAIRSDLPDDLQRYNVFKWSSSDQPVLKVRLASTTDLTTAYDMLDREFKRRIERIPGVARVDITGAPPNEVEIAIDPNRLNAHGLSINELSERLRTLNFSISAGQIDDNGQRVRVQPVGEITDLQEMRDLVINAKGLRLGDIADVRLKPARMNYGRRLDGNPAVGLDIFKERSANLVDVSRAALAEVEAIRAQPSMRDVQIKVIDNQGKAVTSSLLELAEAGAVGLILSVTVLFFFLRHWPSTLMVTLAIPICFTITLGFMYFVGVTLNILTMMGLLLAVGMLVDNAVVVVESIYQERERMPDQPRLASIIGTRNVAIALSAGTLCHCIVFVPNLFGETNNISIFMAQIAITISVSLLASWLVAVSLIPMLSARMATPKLVHSQTGVIARLQRRYAHLLDWSLRHRGWSLLGIVLVVLVSLVPMKLTKVDMFGGEGGKDIFIGYMWKGAYTYRQMSEEVARVENWIDANRERLHVKQVYSWYSEQEGSSTVVTLDEKYAKDIKALQEELRKGLPKSARTDYFVGNQGGDGGGGGNQGVQVQLVGDSSSMLQEIGQEVVPLLAQRTELRDVRIDNGEKGGELKVRVDRERAAAFGFNAEQVASFVGLALRGAPMREFRRGDNEVPVWVRFAGAEQSSPEDLAGFSVRTGDGRSVPLLSLVTVDVGSSATQIGRTNRQTTLTIKANLAEKITAPDGRKAIEAVLKPMNFPAGYGYTFDGGDYGNDDEAMQQMVFNLLIALVMIYVVMAAVFESLLFPAAIMSGVLFSIFGVFWLFWITGTSFGIMSFIGILVLMGVVVNNGIVMIEHINNLRRSGMGRTQALVEGSRERLRPIMMTMGTAILAMVPISLTNTQMFGDGPEYAPMARAIAGGLAFSTVVSLLFLPTIYAVLDDLRNAVTRLIRRARGLEMVEPGAARL